MVPENDREVPNEQEEHRNSVDILLAEQSDKGTDEERTNTDTQYKQADTKRGDLCRDAPCFTDINLSKGSL